MCRIIILTVILFLLFGCGSDDSGVNPAPNVVTTITMLTPVVESCEPVVFIVEVTNVSDEPAILEYCCEPFIYTIHYPPNYIPCDWIGVSSTCTPCSRPNELVLESFENYIDTMEFSTERNTLFGTCCMQPGRYILKAGPIDRRYPRDAEQFIILP